MKANMYKPSEKKKINRVDNQKHWPASIKERVQWFPFLTIMEHTANKTQDDKGLISSLLKISNVRNTLELWRKRFGNCVFKLYQL